MQTIIDKGKETIRIESAVIAELENKIDNNFVKAVEMIYQCKGRVIISGVGKSGIIARKIAATLTSIGISSFFLHPTESIHGDLGLVNRQDIMLIISKSGKTEEFYILLPIFKRIGCSIICITTDKNSEIAKKSDVIIDIGSIQEACPYDLVPTSSTTATLVMGDAIAMALLHLKNFKPEDFALLHPGGNIGKRLLLKVSNIMHRGDELPIVSKDTNMKNVLLEMTSKRLGITCVVDEDNKLIGVITDGDLRRLLERTENIFSLNAFEGMIKSAKDGKRNPPITISEDNMAVKALKYMEDHKITALVVVDEKNSPIGLVHIQDLLKAGVV